MPLLLTLLAALTWRCVPLNQQAGASASTAVVRNPDGTVTYVNPKALRLDDFVYEPGIKAVQFYRSGASVKDVLNLPIIPLQNEDSKLVLEFDELGNDYRNYYFKILACNYDWTPAILQELEYLEEFNEFIARDYELSVGTRVPYVHYSMQLPRLKLSGNYVLVVYRNRNQDDIIITRRFQVYENLVTIIPDIKFPVDPKLRFQGQQIDFTLNYGTLDLFNAREMVKVVVRQNSRWDNAIYNLKPLFIREEDRVLDYHFFNNENVFLGGNEWRYFDARSLRFRGFGVANVTFDNNRADILLNPDASRNSKNYSQWRDANGRFVLQRWESARENAGVEADYVNTTFTLAAPQQPGNVFVFGLLTDWQLLPEYRMTYNTEERAYKLTTKLKQGLYNYNYVYVAPGGTPDYVQFEGTYEQTENNYDFLVYFRPVGSRYDRLIGYNAVGYFTRTDER